MTKPHVLILAPFSEIHISRLRQHMKLTHINWLESMKLQDPEEMANLINSHKSLAVLIESDFIFAETLSRVKSLKFIGICRSAINHVDIAAATQHNIVVANTPARNARAVAEYVLSVILSIARKTIPANQYVQAGMWQNPTEPYTEFRGTELQGKTMGLLGMGAIGKEIAGIMYKLDMKVIAHDPYIEKAPEYVKLVAIDELLEKSDVLATVAPLNEETFGFLNSSRLSQMKEKSILVTVSGVSITDQTALIELLNSGHFTGAAVDVCDTHPIAPDSILFQTDRLILTPHIGGATYETIERHSDMITNDLIRFLDKLAPVNIINPEVMNHL